MLKYSQGQDTFRSEVRNDSCLSFYFHFMSVACMCDDRSVLDVGSHSLF